MQSPFFFFFFFFFLSYDSVGFPLLNYISTWYIHFENWTCFHETEDVFSLLLLNPVKANFSGFGISLVAFWWFKCNAIALSNIEKKWLFGAQQNGNNLAVLAGITAGLYLVMGAHNVQACYEGLTNSDSSLQDLEQNALFHTLRNHFFQFMKQV